MVIGGAIAIGATPHPLMPTLGLTSKNLRRDNARIKTAASRLVKQGFAEWENNEGRYVLRVTELGRQRLNYEKEVLRLKQKPGKWDRRWRMVAFDLPERRRAVRARLRRTMAEIGFVRLQDSVWIFPYDCEDFIMLLKADLKIGKDALYAIVEKLENDKALREHFHLPAK